MASISVALSVTSFGTPIFREGLVCLAYEKSEKEVRTCEFCNMNAV